jgi:hypothetical protein
VNGKALAHWRGLLQKKKKVVWVKMAKKQKKRRQIILEKLKNYIF